MASAKKGAKGNAPATPTPANSKKAPAKSATSPAANGSTTPSRGRGKVIITRSTPVLYPDRDLPPIQEFSNKEITNGRNMHDIKNKTKLDYNVNSLKITKEIHKYRDKFGTDKSESLLDNYLEESITKDLFPPELIKKTVTRRRKRKASEGDTLNALNKLNDTDEEGEDGEEGGEEGAEKKAKAAAAKEKKKEDEESGSDIESEESDGGLDYNVGGMVDDDSEGMDDDEGGGDEGYMD